MKTSFRDFLELCRPATLPYPAIAVLAGAVSALGVQAVLLPKIFLAALAGMLLNAASNALNAASDAPLDKINKPFRPVPSSRITVPAANKFSLALYLASLLISLFVNVEFFAAALLAAAITAAYSMPPLRLRNNFLAGGLAIAAGRGFLPIIAGSLAATGNVSPASLAAGIILFLYFLGASVSKDFADVKGDEKYGSRSLPILVGAKNAALVSGAFISLPFLLVPPFVQWGMLPQSALSLCLLSVWGAYAAFLVIKNPLARSVEGNHPAWAHMYAIAATFLLGVGIATSF
ncbi:MAG: UbiA family prenyltransferase [Candidatus Micrarchaeia archaeon]|jgi:chlorophyll synthase